MINLIYVSLLLLFTLALVLHGDPLRCNMLTRSYVTDTNS